MRAAGSVARTPLSAKSTGAVALRAFRWNQWDIAPSNSYSLDGWAGDGASAMADHWLYKCIHTTPEPDPRDSGPRARVMFTPHAGEGGKND